MYIELGKLSRGFDLNGRAGGVTEAEAQNVRFFPVPWTRPETPVFQAEQKQNSVHETPSLAKTFATSLIIVNYRILSRNYRAISRSLNIWSREPASRGRFAAYLSESKAPYSCNRVLDYRGGYAPPQIYSRIDRAQNMWLRRVTVVIGELEYW